MAACRLSDVAGAARVRGSAAAWQRRQRRRAGARTAAAAACSGELSEMVTWIQCAPRDLCPLADASGHSSVTGQWSASLIACHVLQGRQRGLQRPRLPFSTDADQGSSKLHIVEDAGEAATALDWKGEHPRLHHVASDCGLRCTVARTLESLTLTPCRAEIFAFLVQATRCISIPGTRCWDSFEPALSSESPPKHSCAVVFGKVHHRIQTHTVTSKSVIERHPM